ncbi:MAG: 3-hydroxyacyl-CoA dehydrogenase [Alphaproteobacteria bacterium]|nr:3-hydroxyacyl-CoA dehydrogenase [Alphaproteobacteria bacterium]MBV9372305.1 3-hydroxyacyl-CoA dehydrogenase [Alphaproteobacteria bacterium]MBV9899597.1 3-hydroxyacyl-CoA dehydrogenase [Alphaproteobacteria bacterium]
MTLQQTLTAEIASTPTARLFVLEINAGKIHVLNADGSAKTTIVENCRNPDGIAVDAEAGHIYWTNMGVPSRNDGSIERADLDGGNRVTIVPPGATFTPKQMQIEKGSGKIYWSDREGMRVMRANLDGSDIETLIQTGDAETRPGPDADHWCVGIAVDPAGGRFYWTQKGPDNGESGRLCRAPIDFRPGEDAATRTDIEILFYPLPEPIDLDIDQENRRLYWTDRGNPPRGNSVSRTGLDAEPGKAGPPEIVVTDLMEAIGLALDVPGDRMFVTDLTGSIYTARLDGSNRRPLAMAQGNLTGIAYAEIPTENGS